MAKAVQRDDEIVKYDSDEIIVPANYDGPRLDSLDDITPEWIKQLMQYQKEEKKLHKKYLVMIVNEATKIFSKQETLVYVAIDDLEEITVCGDIHG